MKLRVQMDKWVKCCPNVAHTFHQYLLFQLGAIFVPQLIMCVSRSKYLRREKREKNDHQKQVYVDINGKNWTFSCGAKTKLHKIVANERSFCIFPRRTLSVYLEYRWFYNRTQLCHKTCNTLSKNVPRHVEHHFYWHFWLSQHMFQDHDAYHTNK